MKRMKSWKKNLRRVWLMFPKPLAFTAVVCVIWRTCFARWGHLFPIEDAQAAVQGAGAILVFHALVASRALGRLTSERDQMFLYVEDHEWVKFVRLRDKRMDWFTNFCLAGFAGVALVIMGIVGYKSIITGACLVGGVAFVIGVFWQAAWVADNIVKSHWLDDEPWLTPELLAMTEQAARMHERTEAREQAQANERLIEAVRFRLP